MSIFSSAVTTAATATVVPTATSKAADEAAIFAASSALSTPNVVTIPGLADGALYPWQTAAVEYALGAISRHGGAIIGDDMGLGKTRVALALIAIWRAAAPAGGPVLVVTPPANLGGYQREMLDAFPTMTMHVAQGRKPTRIAPGTDILWMSDDALTMRAWLTCGEEKLADGRTVAMPSPIAKSLIGYIRDEAHRDKGNGGRPATTRSRAAISILLGEMLRASACPVVCMTGTLTTNRPVEALLPLKIAGGSALVKAITRSANEHSFLVRYCSGRQTMVGGKVKSSWDGAQNLPELHQRLRETCYVRREKSDLDPASLPHFGWQIVPFAIGEGMLGTLNRIEKDMLAMIEEQHGVAAAFRAARAETIVRIGKMRAELGRVKADAAVRYVVDLLDDSEGQDSAVVFYEHNGALDALRDAFMRAGICIAEVNGLTRNRRKVEDAFQSRPALLAEVARLAEVIASTSGSEHATAVAEMAQAQADLDDAPQVVLAQLQAAGQALTLTAARHAVWVQLPWSAGMLAQQRDRIRRCDAISAERAARGESVQFHVLEVQRTNGKPTFDAAMWAVVEAKAAATDAVNAGRDVTLPDESVMEAALIEWYAHL